MDATIWLLIAVVCIGVEIAVSSFWLLWFGVAALVDCILVYSGLIPSSAVQLLIFAAISFLLLVFTRPLLLKVLGNKDVKSNVDAMLGQSGVCTMPIAPQRFGQVKVKGEVWTAFAVGEIAEGALVLVEAVEGVKLKVRLSPPSAAEASNPENNNIENSNMEKEGI